jgi:hypothetical protein
VDAAALISSVVSARESTTANQRQIAVASNAVRTEKAAMATLLQAIEQSAAYGAAGQVNPSAVTGTRFAASA